MKDKYTKEELLKAVDAFIHGEYQDLDLDLDIYLYSLLNYVSSDARLREATKK